MFRSPNWSSLFSHVLKIGQYSSSSFSSSSSTSTDQLLPPKSTLCHQTTWEEAQASICLQSIYELVISM
ncbi:hypothetical protein LguiB_016022 [Lonicera macranthoides]